MPWRSPEDAVPEVRHTGRIDDADDKVIATRGTRRRSNKPDQATMLAQSLAGFWGTTAATTGVAETVQVYVSMASAGSSPQCILGERLLPAPAWSVAGSACPMDQTPVL